MSKAVFMSEPIIIVNIVSISILAYFGWTLDRFASHLCPKKCQAKTEGKHEENQTKQFLEFRPPQLKAAEANPTYTQRTMPGCTGASGTPRRRGWNKAKRFY